MSTTSNPTYILGISCFYHDAAAVLICDGQLISAVQEERFTREKHDDSFPINSIVYCLKEAKINIEEISAIVFYEKSLLKLERLLTGFIRSWPFEHFAFISAISVWLRDKIWIKPIIRKKLNYSGPIYFSDHHLSHAASAFFVSPFQNAAILTVDGVGEWATATLGRGHTNQINLLKEIRYPNSLGLLYSAVTHFLGFKSDSDEYKVMGLAPYGQPVYRELFNKFFTVFSDGSFNIDPKVFNANYVSVKVKKYFEQIFGFPCRLKDEPLTQEHKDLAASLQQLTNDTMFKLAKYARKITNEDNLCIAGGVALNCVANAEIFNKAGFNKIFIQPAAGDAGGALGAAYYLWYQVQKQPRSFEMLHSYWGPQFNNDEIRSFIDANAIRYRYLDTDSLVNRTAELIRDQKVIGWFQGRMEWGQRALGNRSILADPTNPHNWQRVNMKIKFRESFRPFAPSVTEEDAQKYFDPPFTSPFMLFTNKTKTDDFPATTHIDKTARIQTVAKDLNPRFYSLLREFEKISGHPVLVNTSFNVAGEPIVCTPEDAFRVFIRTEMDFLVLGNYIIDKRDMKT